MKWPPHGYAGRNIESKLPSGPAPLRRCYARFIKSFDMDDSGTLDFGEFKRALQLKARP